MLTHASRTVARVVATTAVVCMLGESRAQSQQAGPPIRRTFGRLTVTTIADGLNRPWSLAFLPDGTMLVTELVGRLRVIRDGVLDPNPVAGLPDVYTEPYAGLMDVVLHPDFANNQFVYLSYNKEGQVQSVNATAVAVYQLAWHIPASCVDVS